MPEMKNTPRAPRPHGYPSKQVGAAEMKSKSPSLASLRRIAKQGDQKTRNERP
jgi:hypothetical protein